MGPLDDQARILIAVPVLARPHRAAPLVETIREATTVNHRILFLCSPGDDAEIRACEATNAATLVVPWECGSGDYARKINYAVEVSDEPWIFQGADDLCFCPYWAEQALETARTSYGHVIGTNDLGNSRVMSGTHSTHSLVSRRYIEELGTVDEPGKMLHEGYDHNYCDDEMIATARVRKAFAFSPSSEVPHLHPDWNKGQWDNTYAKGKALFTQDRILYETRKRLWLDNPLAPL